MSIVKNVLGTNLEPCCNKLKTGFYRNGYCDTSEEDHGLHVVCARVTAEFLDFSRERGNDLSTPNPRFSFPGLNPGDCWCLCAARWQEAFEAGMAPQVVLAATHPAALQYCSLEDLRTHAVEQSPTDSADEAL